MVPTARAMELAEPVADILARVRRVVSTAEPFDATKSARRFTIGAPDGSLGDIPATVACQSAAYGSPHRNQRAAASSSTSRSNSRTRLGARSRRAGDARNRYRDRSLDEIPARFVDRILYEEDFVIATRAEHPFADDPTLDRYCGMRHLVVSLTGDAHGFVDEALAKQGRSRRVALTVPNFMMALAVVAETDLITALPRRFVAMHAQRFGVVRTESPLSLPRFQIRAITPRVAMMDTGLTWLFELLAKTARAKITAGRKAVRV